MKNNSPLYFKKIAASLIWAGVIMLSALFACGRKTLPMPPDAYVPPAVENLKATVNSGLVTLTWLVPDGQRQLERGLAEIIVFQAEPSGSCADCPLTYQPVASIPAPELAENDRGDLPGAYNPSLVPGRRYIFYVTVRSDLGVEGPRSNLVEVVGPPEDL